MLYIPLTLHFTCNNINSGCVGFNLTNATLCRTNHIQKNEHLNACIFILYVYMFCKNGKISDKKSECTQDKLSYKFNRCMYENESLCEIIQHPNST